MPLYEELYLLLTTEDRVGPKVAWSQLGGMDLCLLSGEMHQRRIVDALLASRGTVAKARVEANSISALLSFARQGWACVVSTPWVESYGVPDGIRALPLVEPEVRHQIGLVTPDSKLVQPLVRAVAALPASS